MVYPIPKYSPIMNWDARIVLPAALILKHVDFVVVYGTAVCEMLIYNAGCSENLSSPVYTG